MGPRGNESYTRLTPRASISAAEVLGLGWGRAKLACFKKYYHHLHRPDIGRCGLVVILFHKRSDALLGSNLGFELGPLVGGAVAGSRWAGGDPADWINYSGLRGAD